MNVAQITSGPIQSVSDLMDLCERLNGIGSNGLSTEWAFRGQPRDFGALNPSFQRQFSSQPFGAAELIEDKLIQAFREHYRVLPDRSPDMPQPAQIERGHDMRCLSVMQHYEIPTRLLDWTGNFWTAIYFACSNDPGITAELWFYHRSIFAEQRRKDPTLEALMDRSANPTAEPELRRRRSQNIVVELDPQISPRMRQQFAHHTVSTSVFSDHAPYLIALAEAMAPPQDPAVLAAAAGASQAASVVTKPGDIAFPVQRVLIDGACKSKALQFLADTMNITASTIFPDVVGLGRFLRWQFDSLRTMLL